MIKDSPQDCNFPGVIFPVLLFILVVVIEVIYVLTRLMIVLMPVYILIECDHYLLQVLCVIYLVLGIIWIYLFMKDAYYLYYGLWHIFCGQGKVSIADNLSDKIIEYYNEILECEIREALVMKYCDNDIESIINGIIGRQYLREDEDAENEDSN